MEKSCADRLQVPQAEKSNFAVNRGNFHRRTGDLEAK
jgi:hypothetical protein